MMKSHRKLIVISILSAALLLIGMCFLRNGNAILSEDDAIVNSKTKIGNSPRRLNSARLDNSDSGTPKAIAVQSGGRYNHGENQAKHTDGPLRYTLLNSNGKITTGAAEAAGLDNKQRQEVQNVLDEFWEAAELDLATRAILNEKSSNSENGIVVYDIYARKDRGGAFLNDLKNKLSDVVGDERGGMLYDSLNKRQLLGGFGQFDVKIEFISPPPPTPESPDPKAMIKFSYTDPLTGSPIIKANMTHSAFKEYFGGSFEFSE